MGCTGSKQARRDRSPAPYNRCYSAPVPRSKGDSARHVVSLANSTLGSLKLHRTASPDEETMKSINDHRPPEADKSGKAKKTPEESPETINAWELMAGLEDDDDDSPLRPTTTTSAAAACGSLSFDKTRGDHNSGNGSPVPTWMEAAPPGSSIVSDFDPEVISTFQKALEELSPQHPFLLRSPENVAMLHRSADVPRFTGIVKARINEFQESINARRAGSNGGRDEEAAVPDNCPPGGEGRVVFYFTSLRGVRKTYEDCWAVRVILQGYGVKVDERDVSLHAGFKEELAAALGGNYSGGGMLPRVFADGKYLGGAEEVRQMHEVGELGLALERCEVATVGKGGVGAQCEGCDGVRFVPCETCSGSCKVFVEDDEEEEEVEVEEDGPGGFRRCPDCNENGLVRCPLCC